jgi:pimeloyl-ACP methyl ester carboxylesterase
MAREPRSLDSWATFLEAGDVILLDQRGTGASRPSLGTPAGTVPPDVFRDRESMLRAVKAQLARGVEQARSKGIDVAAWNTEESADDLEDLRQALGVPKLSLVGFSYGTHLALAAVRRHGRHLERVVVMGNEGPDHNRKLPGTYDTYFRRLSVLAAADPGVREQVPDLYELARRVFAKLEKSPMVVPVPDPRTKGEVPMQVGKFGLQLILIADLGDTSDLPVFPRLLHTIDRGDASVLRWFVEKRTRMVEDFSLMFWVCDASSGASAARYERIRAEAPGSLLGNSMNLIFPEVGEAFGSPDLGDAFRAPIVSDVPTLFVSGTFDANTPPHQAEELRWGFTRGVHLVVENGGHEDLLGREVRAVVRRFLLGEDVSDARVAFPPLRFIPVEGSVAGPSHPSLR